MNSTVTDNTEINRRRFMKRLAQAGVSIAAAGFLGYYFHDPVGPSGIPDITDVSVPDFSIPEIGAKLAVAKGSQRKDTAFKAIKALGGMESFIQKGDRVVLKVNAAFASPAMLSATTHPELVKKVAELCFSAGAKDVTITDNPINDPVACFKLTGIEEAVISSGATLALPRRSYFKPTTVKGGSLIKNWPLLYKPLDKATKLIGMAPLKDHQRSGASMTMKNWYGLLGGHRNIFHQDIHNTIKELAMMVKPTLVILDGTTTMMTNGPTGGALSDLKQTDTMIVGTDQVAVDTFGARLLEKTAADLPFLYKAEKAGVGTTDCMALKPIMI